MTEDLKSHVDEILNAIDDTSKKNISREELEKELNRFMDYGVPIKQAKQTLVKKYGGSVVFTDSTGNIDRTLIADLEPNLSSVKLLGRVIAINPKDIVVKGESKKIFYGILGDESGTIPFTAWTNLEVEKGDVVEVSNAYTREWQGATQLNFGDRVRVEKTDKKRLPEDAFKPRELKVKDLRSGVGRVDITAKVLQIKERETTVNEETKKVFSGIIGDETGKAQFTSWHDFDIKEEDVLRITGGYVKSWKGIPQLTFDQNASVKKLDKSKIAKDKLQVQRMPLHELVEKRGALDVEIEGTVIEIRPGSGLVSRCPDCNRVLMNEQCSIHGKVKGVPDLRVKMVIDDGTGAVGSVLNRELSEKILGITLDECKKMDNNDLINEINNKLFARRILLHGNALGDDFGTNIITKDAKLVELDVGREAERLTNELEGLM